MAHDSYLMMISLSFDEMLSEDEQEELYQHMRQCAMCAEMWSRMNAFDRMLSVQPELSPSVNFVANVMQKVETYQMRRRWTPWMVVTLVVFSVLASLSFAWPTLLFSLGVNRAIAEWPVTGTVLTIAGDGLHIATEYATFAVDSLISWLNFLITNPWALGVVIAALVLSSTYIGLRETMKATGGMEAQSA